MMRAHAHFMSAIVAVSCCYASNPDLDQQLVQSYPLLDNGGFVIEYDAARRIPRWVYECITLENLSGDLTRSNTSSRMSADDRIAPIHQAESDDYKYTGFDRGHMAPAADYTSEPAHRDATFLMTNICPQDSSLNRYYWKRIEDSARDLLATAARVHVITGPLFLPKQAHNGKWYVSYQVIGENPAEEPVAVPTHFFKVIIAEYDSWCEPYALIVPNERIDSSTPLSEVAVPIAAVEKAAGFLISEFLRNQLHISKSLGTVVPAR